MAEKKGMKHYTIWCFVRKLLTYMPTSVIRDVHDGFVIAYNSTFQDLKLVADTVRPAIEHATTNTILHSDQGFQSYVSDVQPTSNKKWHNNNKTSSKPVRNTKTPLS